jgi:molecular chaperone GrpE
MIIKDKDGTRIPIHKTKSPGTETDSVEERMLDVTETGVALTECEEAVSDWRDTTLRLKADMENYRKRQQRWAQEQITHEKDKLLVDFINVLDDMEKAVAHLQPANAVHHGVKLAYDNMVKLLAKEGVVRIPAQNSAFDPTWHEAVAMTPTTDPGAHNLYVTEVVSNGYRIGDRLLRPARVIVGRR